MSRPGCLESEFVVSFASRALPENWRDRLRPSLRPALSGQRPDSGVLIAFDSARVRVLVLPKAPGKMARPNLFRQVGTEVYADPRRLEVSVPV